jgi:hypothetical protein
MQTELEEATLAAPDLVDHERHAEIAEQFEAIRNGLSALSRPAGGGRARTRGGAPSCSAGNEQPPVSTRGIKRGRRWSVREYALQRVRRARIGYWAARRRGVHADSKHALDGWIESLISAAETALGTGHDDEDRRRR